MVNEGEVIGKRRTTFWVESNILLSVVVFGDRGKSTLALLSESSGPEPEDEDPRGSTRAHTRSCVGAFGKRFAQVKWVKFGCVR